MNLCLVGLRSKSIPLGKFKMNVIRKLTLDKNDISKCSRNLNKTEIEHQKLATLSFVNKFNFSNIIYKTKLNINAFYTSNRPLENGNNLFKTCKMSSELFKNGNHIITNENNTVLPIANNLNMLKIQK